MNTEQSTIPDSVSDQHPSSLGVLQSEPLLTVEEVASYLRLQPNTVRGMARRGELPVIKVGRRWRFKRSQIDSWLHEKSAVHE